MLLKIKMALHFIISIFSCAFACIMLLETHADVYPNIFCWVCTILGLICAAYSFVMCCRCDAKIKKGIKK